MRKEALADRVAKAADRALKKPADDASRMDVASLFTLSVTCDVNHYGFSNLAEKEVFAEMRLEKVAVEKRHMTRRAAVERADVREDRAPQTFAREFTAAPAALAGRFFAEKQIFLAMPAA